VTGAPALSSTQSQSAESQANDPKIRRRCLKFLRKIGFVFSKSTTGLISARPALVGEGADARFDGQAAHEGRGQADRGERGEVAGAVAEVY
jgi:hypothetical protein